MPSPWSPWRAGGPPGAEVVDPAGPGVTDDAGAGIESPIRGLRSCGGGPGGTDDCDVADGAVGVAGLVLDGLDDVSLPRSDSVSDMGQSSHGARARTCGGNAVAHSCASSLPKFVMGHCVRRCSSDMCCGARYCVVLVGRRVGDLLPASRVRPRDQHLDEIPEEVAPEGRDPLGEGQFGGHGDVSLPTARALPGNPQDSFRSRHRTAPARVTGARGAPRHQCHVDGRNVAECLLRRNGACARIAPGPARCTRQRLRSHLARPVAAGYQ